MKYSIIDNETGEIIEIEGKEIIKREYMIKQVRYNKLRNKFNKDPYSLTLEEIEFIRRYEKRGKTIKIDFSKDGYVIIKENNSFKNLNLKTLGMLHLLINHTTYDHRIVFKNNKAVNSFPKLRQLLGISEWDFKTIKKDITEYKIIKKEKIEDKTYLLVNPLYILSPYFTLQKIHLNNFDKEQLAKEFYYTIEDMETLELCKPYISNNEYEKMKFEIQPDNYYKIIDDITDSAGIYIIYEKDEIIYIGKSINIKKRLIKHNVYNKAHHKVKCIIFKDIGNIDLYEPYLIKKYSPKYNKEFMKNNITISLPEIKL